MLYAAGARRLVLGLKHGDRLELAPAMARWMAMRADPVVSADTLIVPVPVHWRRLVARRYNQAAVLANALARELGRPCLPDLLRRDRATPSQDGRSVEDRYRNVAGAIRVAPRHAASVAGRSVLILDDVMTSGATFDACVRCCLAAGARRVCVIALARVTKDA